VIIIFYEKKRIYEFFVPDEDAKCQRWMTNLNRTADIPVDEIMDCEEPWF
jgi:hypothetical protein